MSISTESEKHISTENIEELCLSEKPQGPKKQKGSITRNVITNWVGHTVFIIGGFMLPRLINDHLGQERLGLWDFGWSSVSYLGLLTVGLASAVNRYVAKFSASSQWVDMSKAVSCCAFIFIGSTIAGVAITIVLVYLLPWISPPAFLPYLEEMQILLLCLGLSVSIELFFPTYAGIISGNQRYDLLALIESSCHLLLLSIILLILLFGGGLSLLGISVLCMRLIEGILKRLAARRLCPMIKLSAGLITWEGLLTVFTFGGKTMMETISKIGLYQGNSMLIAYLLGPVSLAIYARSIALILHTSKLLFHFGRVFAPSASHFKAIDDIKSLQALMLNGTQSGVFIALPLALFLGILGNSLLKVWMGPGYAELSLLPILIIGHFFSQSQAGTFYALMGMNRHGKASLTNLVCSILSLCGTFLLIKYFQLGLLGVALSVSLAVAIPYLTIIPYLAAKTIEIPLHRYFMATIKKPFLLCLPTCCCLFAARQWAGPNDYQILGSGLSTAGMALTIMYWRWALTDKMKNNILEFILGRG